MRPETLFVALVAVVGVFSATQTSAEPMPQFDAAETAAIARNRLLVDLIDQDPWLVRRLLNHLRVGAPSPRRRHPTAEEVGLIGGTLADNPDLLRGGVGNRNSLEWIDLLRQARAAKDDQARSGSQSSSNRTAEGSLELIEMMKRAKAEKENVNAK